MTVAASRFPMHISHILENNDYGVVMMMAVTVAGGDDRMYVFIYCVLFSLYPCLSAVSYEPTGFKCARTLVLNKQLNCRQQSI